MDTGKLDTQIPQSGQINPENGETVPEIEALSKEEKDGMLSEQGSGHIEITQNAVLSIKRLCSSLLDGNQLDRLQEEHKRLLAKAMNLPPKSEVARCYNMKMVPLGGVIYGEPGGGRVNIPDYAEPYISMHTHPDGRSFSEFDIDSFLKDSNEIIMTAVGNNGRVYLLEKHSDFDYESAKNFFAKFVSQHPNRGKSAEVYESFIEELIEGVKCYGASYYKG